MDVWVHVLLTRANMYSNPVKRGVWDWTNVYGNPVKHSVWDSVWDMREGKGREEHKGFYIQIVIEIAYPLVFMQALYMSKIRKGNE